MRHAIRGIIKINERLKLITEQYTNVFKELVKICTIN